VIELQRASGKKNSNSIICAESVGRVRYTAIITFSLLAPAEKNIVHCAQRTNRFFSACLLGDRVTNPVHTPLQVSSPFCVCCVVDHHTLSIIFQDMMGSTWASQSAFQPPAFHCFEFLRLSCPLQIYIYEHFLQVHWHITQSATVSLDFPATTPVKWRRALTKKRDSRSDRL
jgi:hypothetical protein